MQTNNLIIDSLNFVYKGYFYGYAENDMIHFFTTDKDFLIKLNYIKFPVQYSDLSTWHLGVFHREMRFMDIHPGVLSHCGILFKFGVPDILFEEKSEYDLFKIFISKCQELYSK